MINCEKCEKPLPENGHFIHCSHCDCNYHFECNSMKSTSWRTLSSSRRDAWKCDTCKKRDPKTPSSPKPPGPPEKRKRVLSPTKATNEDIMHELKNLSACCEFMSCKYDDIYANLCTNNKLLESMTTEIKKLKEEITVKDKLIDSLENKINTLEQNQLKNNIEITNIEPTHNENLYEIIKNISNALNINHLSDNSISNIYRTRTNNIKRSSIFCTIL